MWAYALPFPCHVSELAWKVYRGAQGRLLLFQCQQLILRHQVAALTKFWNLPPEFEVRHAVKERPKI